MSDWETTVTWTEGRGFSTLRETLIAEAPKLWLDYCDHVVTFCRGEDLVSLETLRAALAVQLGYLGEIDIVTGELV